MPDIAVAMVEKKDKIWGDKIILQPSIERLNDLTYINPENVMEAEIILNKGVASDRHNQNWFVLL